MASEITHVPRQVTRPVIATLACLADGPCARVDGVAQVNRCRVRFVHPDANGYAGAIQAGTGPSVAHWAGPC